LVYSDVYIRMNVIKAARFLFVALFFLAAFVFLIPISVDAATMSRPFEISGWIPYWRTATGTADALAHLDTFTEVNPFTYSMKSDGTIFDNGDTLSEPWLALRTQAATKNIRYIPTIMWSDREAMHSLLSKQSTRVALAKSIAALVHENGFDGIDIDFENKKAETRDYFSTFLKGLKMRLGEKWLMCTIESRTPLLDRYWGATPPPDAGMYANDLKAINQYCDRVRIMTYDQQSIDGKLREEAHARGEVYGPVADTAWVEKSITMMSEEISKNKLMIGVPTYGYGYDVTAYANNEYIYDILFTFNPGYAYPIAASLGLAPHRGSHGELYFTYLANATTTSASATTTPSEPTPPLAGNSASAAASMIAQANNTNMSFRLLDWPDAESIRQKAELAKKLGVRGISIFKIDGGEDPNMWNVLAPYVVAQAPAVSFTRTLILGSRGADVRSLQVILNSDTRTRIAVSGLGSSGNETELFGSMTLRAVQKFQELHGIAKRGNAGFGRVGPATRATLNQLQTR